MLKKKPDKANNETQNGKRSKPKISIDYVVDSTMEKAVGITVEELTHILQVDQVKGLGPQKFKSAFQAGFLAHDLLNNPQLLPISGKRGDEFKHALSEIANRDNKDLATRAKRYIAQAYKYESIILTYGHSLYPQTLFKSNYPIPILYARGSVEVLTTNKTVACVGSRQIRSPYSERNQEFAEFASQFGFTIVSGFATGADIIGHQAAVKADGSTICVMAGGLDRPFPPENKQIWGEFLLNPKAVFVSEAPFGSLAAGLTLRKRNKLIVALSLGVLISQSGEKGGTMNAYRFGLEQRKPIAIFEDDGLDDTSGNKKISQSNKPLIAIFNANKPDSLLWKRWLQQISYSI